MVDGDGPAGRPPGDRVLTIRYFGAASAAAGQQQEQLAISPAASVAAVLVMASGIHGAPLQAVIARSRFLLDEIAVHDISEPIGVARTLDVLPPFAGG